MVRRNGFFGYELPNLGGFSMIGEVIRKKCYPVSTPKEDWTQEDEKSDWEIRQEEIAEALKNKETLYISDANVLREEAYFDFEDWVSSVGKPEGSTVERYYKYIPESEVAAALSAYKQELEEKIINLPRYQLKESNVCEALVLSSVVALLRENKTE